MWRCAFLYIQYSEAAIRGFLPKNRCRKNRTCTRDHRLDTPTHRHKNGGIYHRTASLFLLVFLFLGGWRQGGWLCCDPQGTPQTKQLMSLGQVQPGGYSGQTSVSPDKAMNLPLRSDNPSAPSRCWGRLKQQRQQQQEGIYHEHHRCDCHIMLS